MKTTATEVVVMGGNRVRDLPGDVEGVVTGADYGPEGEGEKECGALSLVRLLSDLETGLQVIPRHTSGSTRQTLFFYLPTLPPCACGGTFRRYDGASWRYCDRCMAVRSERLGSTTTTSVYSCTETGNGTMSKYLST